MPVMEATSSPPPPQGAAPAGAPQGSLARRILRGAISGHAVLFLSLACFLALWPITPDLATSENLRNLFMAAVPLLAVAIGQTVVLITGGIDLSVTAIIAATSVVGARVVLGGEGDAASVFLGIALMLAVGTGIGLLNGVAITALVMPPFIVTMSMTMCVSGLTLWLTQSKNTVNLPDAFTVIGYGDWLGVPYALLIVLALAILAHAVLTRTLFGRWLYAVGHNPRAALISGVPVRTVTAAAYAISGACAAVGSLIYTARVETGSPTLGQNILLDVIGAAVIGGTSLFGGKGKVLWTVYGVLLYAVIDNTLNLHGLQHFTIMMIKGGVILAAALLDVARARFAGGA